MTSRRTIWTGLSDAALLAQCSVDTYRASGPGGQKRNKTSSAVRLRHGPSGLLVIAEESRSQHENKARALRRMRQALYLNLREDLAPEERVPGGLSARAEVMAACDRDGRLRPGRKSPHYWPAVGVVLDLVVAMEGRVSEAADALATSTANLIEFLREDDKVWEQVNRLRARFGHKLLR
jgi:hypothetical protein